MCDTSKSNTPSLAPLSEHERAIAKALSAALIAELRAERKAAA